MDHQTTKQLVCFVKNCKEGDKKRLAEIALDPLKRRAVDLLEGRISAFEGVELFLATISCHAPRGGKVVDSSLLGGAT